jgi:hypothetical protein
MVGDEGVKSFKPCKTLFMKYTAYSKKYKILKTRDNLKHIKSTQTKY